MHSQEPGLKGGRQDRFHKSLASLKILAANRHVMLDRQILNRRDIDAQIGRAVGVGNSAFHRRVSVNLAGGDIRRIFLQTALKGGPALMYWSLGLVFLCRSAPDDHNPVALVGFLKLL